MNDEDLKATVVESLSIVFATRFNSRKKRDKL
jgi:hypothetical protein